jgi:hypothetical protein
LTSTSGSERGDEFGGRVLVEERDGIDAGEAGQDVGAVVLVDDGPALALEAAHGRVGVDADDEAVAERAGGVQVRDVAAVQDVEAAVGEDDGLVRGPAEAADERRRGRGSFRRGSVRSPLTARRGRHGAAASGMSRGAAAHFAQHGVGALADAAAGQVLAELGGVRRGAAPLAADDGRAVERRDEAAQAERVAVDRAERADRDLAAAFEAGEERALGGGRGARRRVVERRSRSSVSSSSSRATMASAPCPAAGSQCGGSSASPTASSRPNRRTPARARMMPS